MTVFELKLKVRSPRVYGNIEQYKCVAMVHDSRP